MGELAGGGSVAVAVGVAIAMAVSEAVTAAVAVAVGFICFGASIHTHQEIIGLLYAGSIFKIPG